MKEGNQMNEPWWSQDVPISQMLSRKAAVRGIPLHGTFELTSRCNFSCKMCYVHGMENMEQLEQQELTTQEWLDIARQAKEAGMLFLLLTGGEAMLRRDFIELYEPLCEMGFRVVINSNGSMLTPEIVECFSKRPPARINISLYGASDETYRSLCGVPAYESVKTSIYRLREMGISVRVTMMLTTYNCGDMEQVHQTARDAGALCAMSSYLFPPIRLDEQTCGNNPGRLAAEEAGAYMVRRERLLSDDEEFLKRAQWALQQSAAFNQSSSEGLPMQCLAGRASFWLTWDGKMRPCGLFDRIEMDVREVGFAKAWKEIHEKTLQIRLPRACANCPDRVLCHNCAAMTLAETGAFDKRPEYVCRMVEGMKTEYARQLKNME